MSAAQSGRPGGGRGESFRLDPESRAWLAALRSDPPDADALQRLHALLLRAARFELARRRGQLAGASAVDLDDLAQQSADDALAALMRKLDSFRGDSRFSTWAYKFAVLEAAVSARRYAWRDREVPGEVTSRRIAALAEPTPETSAEQAELLRALADAIAHVLTEHQRTVLVAVAFDGVPTDVLAERLGSTRGAVYKTLHDARRRLRAALAERGLELPTS